MSVCVWVNMCIRSIIIGTSVNQINGNPNMIHRHLQGDLLGLKVCWTLVLLSSLVQTCDEASKRQRDFCPVHGRETREVIEVKEVTEVMAGEEFWCKGKDASRGPIVSSLITCVVWTMGTCSSGWFWEACSPHQECFCLNCVWLSRPLDSHLLCSWLWGLLGLIFGSYVDFCPGEWAPTACRAGYTGSGYGSNRTWCAGGTSVWTCRCLRG